MSQKITVTAAQALHVINKRRTIKHVRYAVFIRPFLPTGDGTGFNGSALVYVTKTEFMGAAEDLLRHLEERGARLELTVPTEDFESFIIG